MRITAGCLGSLLLAAGSALGAAQPIADCLDARYDVNGGGSRPRASAR